MHWVAFRWVAFHVSLTIFFGLRTGRRPGASAEHKLTFGTGLKVLERWAGAYLSDPGDFPPLRFESTCVCVQTCVGANFGSPSEPAEDRGREMHHCGLSQQRVVVGAANQQDS